MKIRFSYPVRAPQADVKSAQTQVSAFCPDMSIYSRLQIARHNPNKPLLPGVLHHDSPTGAPDGKPAGDLQQCHCFVCSRDVH
jgi:hypothetical protein